MQGMGRICIAQRTGTKAQFDCIQKVRGSHYPTHVSPGNDQCAARTGHAAPIPNSIPSNSCAYPRESSIDWIFAAGQTRFTTFLRDKYTQDKRISDHPAIIARAHLQD